MTREIDSIIAVHKESGVVGVVTDTTTPGIHAPWDPPHRFGSHYRPGTPSASGSIGCAVDFGNRPSRLTDKQALEVFEVFRPYGEAERLQELFCGQSDWCVYGGKWLRWTSLPKKTRDAIRPQHMNHLHVSVLPGTFLVPLVAPPHPQEIDDMSDDFRVAGRRAPDGGVWVLTRDGGVRAEKGAPFFGSYPGLPSEQRLGDRYFIDIEVNGPRSSDGYCLIASDGSTYAFTPQWWAEHGHK